LLSLTGQPGAFSFLPHEQEQIRIIITRVSALDVIKQIKYFSIYNYS